MYLKFIKNVCSYLQSTIEKHPIFGFLLAVLIIVGVWDFLYKFGREIGKLSYFLMH